MFTSSLLNMGPATEALKRSTKRRRLSETASFTATSSFQLDDMFHDLNDIDQEAFPSIGWNFDDDDNDDDKAAPDATLPPSSVSLLLAQNSSFGLCSYKQSTPLSGSKRQSPGGMVRSKAFCCGLDTMTLQQSEPLQLQSIAEALPLALKSTKLDHNSMYILSSSLPPSSSRRKNVGPSGFFATTQRMRA